MWKLTHLIFINPEVKINEICYCDLLLSQELLPAICQLKADEGLVSLYNNVGLISKGSKDIASKSTKNSRCQQLHYCLMPHLQGPQKYLHKLYIARN